MENDTVVDTRSETNNESSHESDNETGSELGSESGRDSGWDSRNGARFDANSVSKSEKLTEEKTSLFNEWSLFWDSLKRERPQIEGDFDHQQFKMMSLSQTKDLIRVLSQDRRKMNQKIESINKEIGLNTSKLESVRLAGADEDSILKRINELNDQGQKLSLELASLDEKLRRARDIEGGLKTFHFE